MSGSYYSANPHYARPDYSEQRERQESAEAHASRWFNDLTKPQLAIYNERMAVAAAYKGAPKWDRFRDAAEREFKRTTTEAAQVSEMVFGDMMAFGEITEATSYAFDRVLAGLPADVMQAAE